MRKKLICDGFKNKIKHIYRVGIRTILSYLLFAASKRGPRILQSMGPCPANSMKIYDVTNVDIYIFVVRYTNMIDTLRYNADTLMIGGVERMMNDDLKMVIIA